jgi:tryptophan 2,3-dioxygenase
MSPTYSGYLRLPLLLDQQHPETSPAVHDEALFITVHQAYELWFKQILYELTDARDRLLDGDAHEPRSRLERCLTIGRLLIAQFDVLDTMSPQGFAKFRRVLGTGSGRQSAQFWEIAYLSGAKDPEHLDRPWHTAEERARLRRRFEEPSVWDGFLTVLGRAGFDVATQQRRSAAYLRIARDLRRHEALWLLAEALVAYDQAWALWQERHLLTVQRQIGGKRGTGRSAGAAYLKTHHNTWFFPELWELRTLL